MTIQGSYVGSLPEMAEMMELVRRKGLPDVPVTTRRLDEVNAAHADLRAGKIVGRVVLTPAKLTVIRDGPQGGPESRRDRVCIWIRVARSHASRNDNGMETNGRQRTARHAGADQGALQERSAGRAWSR